MLQSGAGLRDHASSPVVRWTHLMLARWAWGWDVGVLGVRDVASPPLTSYNDRGQY